MAATLTARPSARPIQESSLAEAGDTAGPQTDLSDGAYVGLIGMALVLGVVVRMLPFLGTAFPIGDGGLFYAMVQDLVHHHYALPMTTSYNRAHVPFAYPPLAFYITALFWQTSHLPLIQVFRYLPLTVTVLSIPAFIALLQALRFSRIVIAGASIAFALLPEVYDWQIRGGGVTRSLGFLFALLAIRQVALLCQRSRRRDLVLAVVFAALTCLSHLEWAWFAATSCAVVVWFYGRNRRGLIQATGLAAGVLLLTAPWWLLLIERHWLSALLATATGSSQALVLTQLLIPIVELRITTEVGIPVIAVLGMVGLMAAIVRRQWLLPVWYITILCTTSRGPFDKSAVVLVVLAGFGLYEVLGAASAQLRRVDSDGTKRYHRILALTLAFLVLHAVIGTGLTNTGFTSLSPAERTAMQWVTHHTGKEARFLIVSSSIWAEDDNAEWFPAVTGRTSVDTVQGFEWLPHRYVQRIQRYDAVQHCVDVGVTCLDHWRSTTGTGFQYVYVTKRPTDSFVVTQGLPRITCCQMLRESLDRDHRYVRVFSNTGASIYRILD